MTKEKATEETPPPVEEEREKPKKKKLIKVEGRGGDGQYASTSVYFALITPPAEGKRKQATNLMTCRDHLNDSIRSHVQKDENLGCSQYTFGSSPPIDMDKLRLLITRSSGDKEKLNTDIRDKIFSGKAAINLYEGIAGWEKSKITTVTHDTLGKQAWLLTGSGNWMKASNLLSMVTLIIRLASNHGPLRADNLEELNKHWVELLTKSTNGYDTGYLKNCYDKFELIMKHHEKIFCSTLEENYPRRNNNFHAGGGINALCTFATNIEKVDQRFKKIYEAMTKE